MIRTLLLFIQLGIFSGALAQAQKNPSPTSLDSLINQISLEKNDSSALNSLLAFPKEKLALDPNPQRLILQLHMALKKATQNKDKRNSLRILNKLGSIQIRPLYNEPKAFEYYQKALPLAIQLQDFDSARDITFDMAVILEHQGQHTKMFQYLEQSIVHAEKSNKIFLSPFEGMITMLLEENRIQEAYNYAKKSLDFVIRKEGSKQDLFYSYGYLLEVTNRSTQYQDKAQIYRQKIKDMVENNQQPTSKPTKGYTIARIYLEAKLYRLAIEYSTQMLNQLDLNLEPESSMFYWEILSKAYEALGQHQKSLENHKKFLKIYIKVLLRDVATAESGRQLQRLQNERDLLLKQNEIDKARFYRNIGSLVSLFAFLSGLLIYFFYRREQKQKKKLEQLNQTKDKLFAILSHDIRSPIGLLENLIQLTQLGVMNQSEFNQLTHRIGIEIGLLRSMLDNLLQWTISQMGGWKTYPQSIRIAPQIQQLIATLEGQLSAKNLTIINQMPPNFTLEVDPNHLDIILRNLLQNAIKYSFSGQSIYLNGEESNQEKIIRIQDTGCGISEPRLQQIFEIHKDPSPLGTKQETGTGLGLILVKELTQTNQGSIEIQSQEGHGTTITLRFKGN